MEETESKRDVWLQITFFISTILFVVVIIGVNEFTTRSAVVLTAIILFHEAGHYIGMKLFDYHGVHMFFIPFLGAITVGHKKLVTDWQHAIVVLLGPLPGIFTGLLLYFIYAAGLIKSPFIVETTFILLAVNGFNLLPVLPLDGGQIVHHLIFVKHPITDFIFPVLSVFLIAFLAFILRNWVFLILIISPLLSIIHWFDRAKKRTTMRKFVEKLDIPAHFHSEIVEVSLSFQGTINEVELQEAITRIFTQKNKRLQSVIRNLGLLSLYVGAIVLSIGVAIYLTRAAFTQLQLDASQRFEIMNERSRSLSALVEGYYMCVQSNLLKSSNAQAQIVYDQRFLSASPNSEDEATHVELVKAYTAILELAKSTAQVCKDSVDLTTESAQFYAKIADDALNLTKLSVSIENTPQNLFLLLNTYENDRQLSKDRIRKKERELEASRITLGLHSVMVDNLKKTLKNVQSLAEIAEKTAQTAETENPRMSVLYKRLADAYRRIAHAKEQDISLKTDLTHFESIKERLSESEQNLWNTIYSYREAQINTEQAIGDIEKVHVEEDLRELFPPPQESN